MRRRNFTRWMPLVFVMAVLLVFGGGKAKAATMDQGICGDDLEWTLSDSGVLTITGTGEMTGFAANGSQPWYEYGRNGSIYDDPDTIERIVLQPGVTAINDRAFYGIEADIIIPDTVVKISGNNPWGGWAYFTRSSPINIYFYGTRDQWNVIDPGIRDTNVYCLSRPSITAHPKAVTAAGGQTASFHIKASGKSLTYQWQYSTDGGKSWKNWNGGTSSQLNMVATDARNGRYYRCRITDAAGTSVWSQKAKLTVLKTGLEKKADGKYHLLQGGVEQTSFTGLYDSPNGKTYYIKKGILSGSTHALIQRNMDGKYLYIKGGIWQKDYTGLYNSPNGKTYYIYKGILAGSTHAMIKRDADGKWVYIKGGIWQKDFKGFYTSASNGKVFYVVNGVWQSGTTALIKRDTDGKWVYIKGGYFQKDFTGIYTAAKTGEGYYVVNGVWQSAFNGTKTLNGINYTIKGGKVQ